jgi:hypothetical protein
MEDFNAEVDDKDCVYFFLCISFMAGRRFFFLPFIFTDTQFGFCIRSYIYRIGARYFLYS